MIIPVSANLISIDRGDNPEYDEIIECKSGERQEVSIEIKDDKVPYIETCRGMCSEVGYDGTTGKNCKNICISSRGNHKLPHALQVSTEENTLHASTRIRSRRTNAPLTTP